MGQSPLYIAVTLQHCVLTHAYVTLHVLAWPFRYGECELSCHLIIVVLVKNCVRTASNASVSISFVLVSTF